MFRASNIFQFTGHTGAIYSLENGFSANDFFSGSTDKVIALWNATTFSPEKFVVKAEAAVYSICCIAEKNLLIFGQSDGSIHVIDTMKKREIRNFVVHKHAVFDIKYSAKCNKIFAAGGDGSFSVWNAIDLSFEKQVFICNEKLRKIAFNSDHSLMALACGDGSIRVFDTNNIIEKYKLTGHKKSVYSVAFHPQKNILVSGGYDAYLRFWNGEKHFEQIQNIPAHNYAIYDIQFNETGDICATASRDKTIKIWDAENFLMPLRLDRKNYNGHINSVNKLLWFKNDLLISSGDDQSIIIWKVEKSDIS